MTKAEILCKLNLEELIGTPFEGMIAISKMKKGEYIYHEGGKNLSATYIIEGHLQHIIYIPEGGEFYLDLFPGRITGIHLSLSKRLVKKIQLFDVDVIAKSDSQVAYLPFEKIMDLQFEGKSSTLEKLTMMGVEEHLKKSKYLFFKNIYSDEEFFIKYLERYKTINTRSTKELSELLNINQRSIQRFLKKLLEEEIIEINGERIQIKDQAKLGRYKEKFKK